MGVEDFLFVFQLRMECITNFLVACQLVVILEVFTNERVGLGYILLQYKNAA